MTVRYKSLSDEQVKTILSYYKRHTANDTCRKFNLCRSNFNDFICNNNLTPHDASKAETIKHLKQDGYDLNSAELEQNIVNKAIELNSITKAANFFSVKEYYVAFLLAENNISGITVDRQISSNKLFEQQLASTDHKAVIDFYLAPNSLAATTSAFNITATVVKAILQQANVPMHSSEITNSIGAVKRDETVLAKYGVKNVFQSEQIKEKSSATKLEKYGDANFTNRAKASKTCLERYGTDTFLASEVGQSAIKKYNQERYGCDYAFQSDEWQHNPEILAARIESMSNNKYSATHYSDLYLQVCRDKDSFSKFIENKTVNQLITELNVNRDHIYYLLCKYNLQDSYKKDFSGTSLAEQELVDFIGADLCECSNRTILDGKEIDIYVPTKKLGIEFNGTHWHSTEINTDKNYHFNKSKLAAEKGIRLIHIYEYEWNDKVQQEKIKMLLDIALGHVKTRIFAKNCIIKQISNTEARKLNDKVHLQGHRNAQVTYGLYYNNELVQLMSFSRTKYNRNLADDNSWEIIRGCPGSNNIVVGGVSKLLKHFIADYKPSKVFSYCDFNKFDGKSYEACGMKFIGYTGPDMKWVMPDYSVVNRQPSKHAELKERAIAQIFGAGSKKYQLDLDSTKDYSV